LYHHFAPYLLIINQILNAIINIAFLGLEIRHRVILHRALHCATVFRPFGALILKLIKVAVAPYPNPSLYEKEKSNVKYLTFYYSTIPPL